MVDLSRVGDLALELAEDLVENRDTELGPDVKLLDALIIVELDLGDGSGRTIIRHRSTTERLALVVGLVTFVKAYLTEWDDVDDDDDAGP